MSMSQEERFYEACEDGDVALVRQTLVDAGDNARSLVEWRNKNQYNYTPLHGAAENGHAAVAEVLVAARAPVDARDEWQWTPLHQAAMQGHAAVAEVLVAARAPVDARDEDQWTPLHHAAIRGQAAVVEVLLAAGAAPAAVTKKQYTPLSLAKTWGHSEVIKMLERAVAGGQEAIEQKRHESQLWSEELERKQAEQEQLQINRQSNEGDMQKLLESSELDVVAEWLGGVELSEYYERLVDIGIKKLGDLEDLDDDILKEDVGMTKLHINKFKRFYNKLSGTPELQDGNLVFISHYKAETGTDARLVKTQMALHFQRAGISIPDDKFFLDSDNLHDLHALTEQVVKSTNFFFLLSSGVFTRPWCLVELVTAIDNGCRILPIELKDSRFSFNFEVGPAFTNDFSSAFLSFPGKTQKDLTDCLEVLGNCGVDIPKVQNSICHVLKLIAKPLHFSSMSQAVLSAEIGDIVKLMNV